MLAVFTAVTLILMPPPPVPAMVTQTATIAVEDRTLPVGGHDRRLRLLPGEWEWATPRAPVLTSDSISDNSVCVAARGPPSRSINGRCPAGFWALSGA